MKLLMRRCGKSSPVTNLKGLVTSSSPFSPFSLSDMIAMGDWAWFGRGRGGNGRRACAGEVVTEVVRSRLLASRRSGETGLVPDAVERLPDGRGGDLVAGRGDEERAS